MPIPYGFTENKIQNAYPAQNHLVNPHFRYAQQYVGLFPLTLAGPGAGAYALDQWWVDPQDGSMDVAVLPPADPVEQLLSRTILQLDQTVPATAQPILAQPLEDLTRFWDHLSLAFYAWVPADTLDVTVKITQRYGSGGAPDPPDVFTKVITIGTDSFTRYGFSTPIEYLANHALGTNNDDSLLVSFEFPSGVPFTVKFGHVQLEHGRMPGLFMLPDPGDDLMRCMRFYEKSVGHDIPLSAPPAGPAESVYLVPSGAGPVDGVSVPFKVEKVSPPTVNTYSPVTGAPGAWHDLTAPGDAPLLVPPCTGKRGFVVTSAVPLVPGNEHITHWEAISQLTV